MKDFTSYYAAIAADDAWGDELRRLFKGAAGDVRYTKLGAGTPGSRLRELHDAKMAADATRLATTFADEEDCSP